MKVAIPAFRNVIILIAFLSFFSAVAQPWMQKPYFKGRHRNKGTETYTFYDVQNAFRKYEKEFDREEKREEKEEYGSEEENEGKFPGYSQYKRWEWKMEPRVYPSGDLMIPEIMMKQYIEEQKAQNQNKNTGVINSSQSLTGSWSPLGPFNSHLFAGWYEGVGRLSALRFDPTNSSNMWACSPLGGLWKSTDGGQNWAVSNTDNNAEIGCMDVAIDPTNTNKMYIATGDADGKNSQLYVSSQGVLKSTDGGITWSPTALVFSNVNNHVIYKLLINPNNPQIILAATDNGIYRTTNAGAVSWAMVPTTLNYNFTDMEFNPLNPNIVYATSGLFNNGRLHKSIDGGATWSIVSNGLPAPASIGRCAIALTPLDTSKIYLVASNTSAKFYGFYVSNNSGASFSLRSNSPDILVNGAQAQAAYDMAIAISPTDTAKLLVGGMLLYRSLDGGITWSLNGSANGIGVPFVHTDHHDIQFIPGSGSSAYISVNDGGLTKTTNDGTTWTTINNGLQISQMYKLGTSKLNPNVIMTGLQDNSTQILQGGNWSVFTPNTGDGMECIFGNHTDSVVYISCYNGRILRTLNKGATYNWIVNIGGAGINATSSWITPNVQHPTLDSTLLVGKAQVYRTSDMGNTWLPVGSVTGGSTNVVALAYAPSDPNYIYAAKTNKLFVCTNGNTFGDSTHTLPVGSAQITSIAVSNTDPKKVWVTFSGYSAANKVWYSSNAGSTWSNFSTGLPNLPVNTSLYINNSSNALLVGTDVGIYFISDSLVPQKWQKFMTGLPNVDVEEMEIAYSISKIRAATDGRGLWESDLPIPLAQFNTNAICASTPATFTDLSTGNPTAWQWSFPGGVPASSNSQNPVVTYNAPGSYVVTLSSANANGSTVKTVTITVNSSPLISLSASSNTICVNDNPVALTGTPVGGTCTGAGVTGNTFDPSISGVGTFTISYNYTDVNNCSGADSVVMVVGACTVIKNNTADQATLIPNPSNGKFRIEFGDMTGTKVRIYNVSGETIYYNENSSGEIDLTPVAKGIYFVEINRGDKKITRKLIIQ